METKFTKGPWVARGKTPSRIYGMLREDKEVIVAACGNVIEQAAANAHLIAAAPEMYDFLDMLMSTTGPGDAAQLLAEKRENIITLLSKARGEQ